MQLVRLEGEDADEQRPHRHAEAAVGEDLDVEAQHSRVQLRAPVVVEDDVARRARVGGRGRHQPLDVESQAQQQAEDVQQRQHLVKAVVDDGGREGEAGLEDDGEDDEGGDGDEEAGEAVVLVLGPVAFGRQRPVHRAARHQPHEGQSEGAVAHEDAHHGRGRRVHVTPHVTQTANQGPETSDSLRVKTPYTTPMAKLTVCKLGPKHKQNKTHHELTILTI